MVRAWLLTIVATPKPLCYCLVRLWLADPPNPRKARKRNAARLSPHTSWPSPSPSADTEAEHLGHRADRGFEPRPPRRATIPDTHTSDLPSKGKGFLH